MRWSVPAEDNDGVGRKHGHGSHALVATLRRDGVQLLLEGPREGREPVHIYGQAVLAEANKGREREPRRTVVAQLLRIPKTIDRLVKSPRSWLSPAP